MSSSFSIYVFKCDLLIVHIVSANTVSCCPQSVLYHIYYSKTFFYFKQQCREMLFAVLTVFSSLGFDFDVFLSYIWCWVDQSRKAELIIFTIASTIQRRIQNQVRHITRSFFTKKRLVVVSNFRKKLHRRCLTGIWMRLCYHCVRKTLDWNSHLDNFGKKGIIHLVRTQNFLKN